MNHPKSRITKLLSAMLKSGDDDLFVQAVAQTGTGTVHYLMEPETFVYSDAPANWRSWFH